MGVELAGYRRCLRLDLLGAVIFFCGVLVCVDLWVCLCIFVPWVGKPVISSAARITCWEEYGQMEVLSSEPGTNGLLYLN